MYLCTEIEVLGCSGSSILDGHTGRTQKRGWGRGCTPDQLKLKMPKFSFSGGGGEGGYSRPTLLKYLSGGTQGILNQKFYQLECVMHHR